MLTNVNPRYKIRHRVFPNYVRRNYIETSLLMKANLDLWNRAARFSVLLILNSGDTMPIRPAANQVLCSRDTMAK